MDLMLGSKLGLLRTACSLPLFSDSICLKAQSAAEHGFTGVLLAAVLCPLLGLDPAQECELLELCIFSEMPKAYLGDPSYHLRKRHPEAQALYNEVRGRLWQEMEVALGIPTTRHGDLFTLHGLIDSFAAMLFIEKECVLGNGYFTAERYRTRYHAKRQRILQEGQPAPVLPPAGDAGATHKPLGIPWEKVVRHLDTLHDEATRARLEGGIGEYSGTFIGMTEKLKEHYRYKGWTYVFPESVGEHTFQVVFLSRLVGAALSLPAAVRRDLYVAASLHDLAESYASDVIYPVKVREKDLAAMHSRLEEEVLERLGAQFSLSLSSDPLVEAIVEIADRYSAKLYFDRERRSGNTHFQSPLASLDACRDRHQGTYPEVFAYLDGLWEEYSGTLSKGGQFAGP